MAERGLILLPEFTVDLTENRLELRNIGGPSMVQAVRRYLPYWDKFDLPDNPIIAIGLPSELAVLAEQGIVRKSAIRVAGFSGNAADLWVLSQLAAWRLNEECEPGQWSLGQQAEGLWLPAQETVRTRAIEIELYQALPVPGDDVSFAEILEFKSRRSSELQAFRTRLDELYLAVVSSQDIIRSKETVVARLDQALADLHKVTGESWGRRFFSSVKVELSSPAITMGALGGVALATEFALPIAAGAALGAVAAAVKFELKPAGPVPRLPHQLVDFAYIYHAERELDR